MKAAFFFHPQPPTLSLFFLNLDSPRVAFTVINFEGKFFFFPNNNGLKYLWQGFLHKKQTQVLS